MLPLASEKLLGLLIVLFCFYFSQDFHVALVFLVPGLVDRNIPEKLVCM